MTSDISDGGAVGFQAKVKEQQIAVFAIVLAASVFVILPGKMIDDIDTTACAKRNGAAMLYAVLSCILALMGCVVGCSVIVALVSTVFICKRDISELSKIPIPPWFFAAAVAFFILLIWSWYIKWSTTCPKCKKSFVVKEIGDVDFGGASNACRKKVGERYHTSEKHGYDLPTHRCSACGHKFRKTVWQEKSLAPPLSPPHRDLSEGHSEIAGSTPRIDAE